MVTATAFGRLPVTSDTGPQITLGDAAAEPDTPSKRRDTAPRHRHNPVRGKAETLRRRVKNCARLGNCARFLGFPERRPGAQPARGACVISASPHTPELM
jgi:hypothetical protein